MSNDNRILIFIDWFLPAYKAGGPIISVKNINKPYNTNSIVLLGIFSALVGISATYIGIDSAFSSVSDISKISPQILINGLKTSLITSITGGIIMLVSTGLWYFFIRRYNLLDV